MQCYLLHEVENLSHRLHDHSFGLVFGAAHLHPHRKEAGRRQEGEAVEGRKGLNIDDAYETQCSSNAPHIIYM